MPRSPFHLNSSQSPDERSDRETTGEALKGVNFELSFMPGQTEQTQQPLWWIVYIVILIYDRRDSTRPSAGSFIDCDTL